MKKINLSQGYDEKIKKLKEEIETADAILIGAGSGLSTAAGFEYTGESLTKYFGDFVETVFGICIRAAFTHFRQPRNSGRIGHAISM